jgi:hypothetical protein
MDENKITLYVHPKSNLRKWSIDEKDQMRHWIFEIHFVNTERQIGNFISKTMQIGSLIPPYAEHGTL